MRDSVRHPAYDSSRMIAQARISVVIVDDHRAFGEALAIALEKEHDLEVVAVTADGAEAVHVAAEVRPDVILLDLEMPGMGGLEASPRIREASEGTTIIILTGSEDTLAHGRAVEAGAHGFLQKTAAIGEVADAVRRAHQRRIAQPAGRGRSGARAGASRSNTQRRYEAATRSPHASRARDPPAAVGRAFAGRHRRRAGCQPSHAPHACSERADEARCPLEAGCDRRGDPSREGSDARPDGRRCTAPRTAVGRRRRRVSPYRVSR